MSKFLLNTIYLKAKWVKDPDAPPNSQFAMKKISDDALIEVIKDDETNTSEIKIIERPTIEFYTIKDRDNCKPWNEMYISKDLVDKHVVEYSKREIEICKCLGIEEEYKRLKREANGRFYDFNEAKEARNRFKSFINENIYKSPYIYGADVTIEDYYKTKFMIENNNALPRKLNVSFYDIETYIYHFKTQVDQNNPEAPVNIITYFNNKTRKYYCLILRIPEILVQQELERDIKSYLDEFVKEDFEDDPDIYENLEIKWFDSEILMIQAFFQLIHMDKPDFALAWNSNYDNKYMIGRLQRANVNVAKTWCHPDIPEMYQQFRFDEDSQRKEKVFNVGEGSGNKKHYSRLWDWITCPGYTIFIDQMSLYSNLRKRSIENSYKLDAIAEKEIHANKVDLHEFGLTIRNAPFKNFKIFLKYSIRDTYLLHKLEERNNDLITFISLADNTFIKDGVNVSIIIKNAFYMMFLNTNRIIGNTIDYGVAEKIDGALVQDPTLVSEIECVKINGEKTKIFKNVVDWDAKSLYPSLMCQHQMGKENQRYRIVNITDENDRLIMTGQRYNQFLQTKDVSMIDLAHELYGLPNIEDVLGDLEKRFMSA